jgi:RNA polymerase sigma-70 factor (ECF subfamily)
MTLTEQDIIDGCQRREARYQQALVTRYAPVLLGVAQRYMGDRASAEDVLQDALVKVLMHIDKYQPTGSFEAWLKRIVINTALKDLGKRRLRTTADIDVAQNVASTDVDAIAHMSADECLSLIARLPNGYREVFNLYVIEEYPHQEIAQMLGISENTSRSQFHRARQLLMKMFTAQNYIR